MSGEPGAAASSDPVPLLWEAVELLSDRPCFALRRDAARTSLELAAAIECFLADLRIRHDATLSVLPDLTARTYLAYRDDDQSCEAIASLLGLSVADVERRLDDAIFVLAGLRCRCRPSPRQGTLKCRDPAAVIGAPAEISLLSSKE